VFNRRIAPQQQKFDQFCYISETVQDTMQVSIISWTATMWGQAVVIVRVVSLSVRREYLRNYGYYETRIGTWASRFRICHQMRDRKYGSAILGVSGLTAHSDRNGLVGLVNVMNGSVGTVTSRHHTYGHRDGPAIVIKVKVKVRI